MPNKHRKQFDGVVVPGTNYIDYKNLPAIVRYISIHGRIKPRYYTKMPLVLQKRMARAAKNARYMALIPFVK